MKVALASLAVIGLAAAQDLSGIPTCALGCITKVIPSSACSLTDVKCFCNAEKQAQIQNLAGNCLNEACTAAELIKAENATKSICAELTSTAPATVTVTAGSSSSSSASSSSASTTGTNASNSTVSTSSTSSANSTSTGYHNSTTVSTATKTSSTGDQTATITTTTTQTPTKTPNAAAGTAVGALFAVVAFAFAL
ncbi:hypothetical protein NQ176_g5573 [Zarea fungicola]|uniref:Uncharacterized protein n=1 Tax=Zarea fungicola TaxID=93591 RepID=A0ACC1N8D9_9HYPO|nr:hypothetical protein NQ176_g5573 [Lecanicillium fungicola]